VRAVNGAGEQTLGSGRASAAGPGTAPSAPLRLSSPNGRCTTP
jgi:hypothetical protein